MALLWWLLQTDTFLRPRCMLKSCCIGCGAHCIASASVIHCFTHSSNYLLIKSAFREFHTCIQDEGCCSPLPLYHLLLTPTQLSLPYSCLNCFETHWDGPGPFVRLWEPAGLNWRYPTKGSDSHSPRVVTVGSSVAKHPVNLLCPPWFIVDKSSFVMVQWDNYSIELIIAVVI